MKNISRFFVTVVCSVLLINSNSDVFAKQDWEYWSKYSLEIVCGKRISFSLEPQFKFKNTFKEYYYSKTYWGISYKLNKFIKVKSYYARKTKKDKTGWRGSDLFYLDPILRFNLHDMDLSNRFRWEYDFDKKEWVYRNRLKLEKNLYKSITPFIQEEIFYSLLDHQFKENRFSVGCSVKMLNWTSFSGEYMLNSKKVKSGWPTSNVLVTTLNFMFQSL